jgi:flagellar motor switch protein FliN/FliY
MAPDETKEIPDTTIAANSSDTVAASGNPVETEANQALFDVNKLGILNDVSIVLTIEVGRTQIKIRDLLNLTKDSIIDLNKQAGEPVDIYANGKLIARGNIITANGKYCVRLMSLYDKPQEA